MNENNPSERNESDDSKREEQLRTENELLKLKIQAQFGGMSDNNSDLPPELENEFLKNVLAFEGQYNAADAKKITVAQLLGNPSFKPADSLTDEEIEYEWKMLEAFTEEKAMAIIFLRERDSRTKYKFVTEELFRHEVNEAPTHPGLIWHFTYEQFHPDHELEIRNQTMDFLASWFERDIERLKNGVIMQYIHPDNYVLTQKQILSKIQEVYDSFQLFENRLYFIAEVKFELHDSKDGQMQGIGHSEGIVKYDAILESGERKIIEGPFKLYMTRDYDWWNIFYFVMPGFE